MEHKRQIEASKRQAEEAKPVAKQPTLFQTYSRPLAPTHPPKLDYLGITKKNDVPKQILESLGGIKDTVSPMEESLRQNEMRPFDYVRDIPSAIKNLKEQPSNFATQPSDLKLISASPYRASVMVVDSKENEDDSPEEDFRNDVSPMSEYKKSRTSPIRDDSQILRHRCDEYLTQFNPQNQAETTPPHHRPAHSMSELVISPRQQAGILKTPKQEYSLPE